MNRLTKFNQVLYAIIGVLFLIVLLVASVQVLLDLMPDRIPDDDTLIVKDELDSLKEHNLRNQIISIKTITQFDTANHIYIIPVTHKKLNDPSSRNSKVLGLMSNDYEDYYYSYGNWNNLILYDFNTLEYQVLLDHRINIDNYRVLQSKKKLMIVFTGWSEDTNNDRKLDEKDFKELYVFDQNQSKLSKVENSEYQISEFKFLPAIDKIIIHGTKVPANPAIDLEELPEFLLVYSFKDNSLKPLVDFETLNIIQEIIDN